LNAISWHLTKLILIVFKTYRISLLMFKTLKLRKQFGILLAPFLWTSAQAYVLETEYHSISEDEPLAFDDPSSVGAEYDSDYFTYLPRVGPPTTFLATVGSLDAKHFFLREKLAAQFNMADALDFRVVHFKNQDFEDSTGGTNFEFRYREPVSKWGLAIYGDVDYLKRRDDVGVALLHFGPDQTHNRLYVSAVDFSRNQRNVSDDRFENNPLVYGFSSERMAADNYLKFNLHREAEVQWRRPTENRHYNFEKTTVLILKKTKSNGSVATTSAMYDKKAEGERPDDADSTVLPLDWNRERLLLDYNRECAWGVLGLNGTFRRWTRNQQDLSVWAVGPMIGFPIQKFSSDTLFWRSEYSFLTSGNNGRIDSVSTPNPSTEHRLNFRAIWRPNERVEFTTLLTFDVDRLSESDRWEGGSMQMSANF
jgi:hypothetical protein